MTFNHMAAADFIAANLRPVHDWDWTTDPPTPLFDPPLTAAERDVLLDLRAIFALGVQTLTLAEYRARKADVAGIKAYMALASPTATQTRDAFRALIRVVGAMLKVEIS